MVTEESAKKAVKTIVQGMPVDAVYPRLLTLVLSFRTGGLGCNAHPAFPAPSFIYEGDLLPTTRTFRAARMRDCVSTRPVIASEAKQSRVAYVALDCFASLAMTTTLFENQIRN